MQPALQFLFPSKIKCQKFGLTCHLYRRTSQFTIGLERVKKFSSSSRAFQKECSSIFEPGILAKILHKTPCPPFWTYLSSYYRALPNFRASSLEAFTIRAEHGSTHPYESNDRISEYLLHTIITGLIDMCDLWHRRRR